MSLSNVLNDDWHDDAVKRAKALYPNQGMHAVASLMARTGRFAIDYMEQAPAVLTYVSWGSQCRRYSERALVAQRFGSAVWRGAKLRDMLVEFQAPYPIRKVCGQAVIPSNTAVILGLRKVPNSELAQAIPSDDVGQQLKWMRFLRDVLDYFSRYSFSKEYDRVWHWSVKAGGAAAIEGIPHFEKKAGDLCDLFVRGDGFNPDWTFRGALAAMDRWHAMLAAKADQEKFLREHGFAFDDVRDYAPLPESHRVGPFDFTALRSGAELFVEGRAMRHCVASYVRHVMLGGTRIYSVRKGEDRMATVELHPRGERFVLAQCKGHCNAVPRKEVRDAVAVFVRDINDNIREAA